MSVTNAIVNYRRHMKRRNYSPHTLKNYMNTLMNASSRYVLVLSTDTEYNSTTAEHVRNREFSEWIRANAAGWKLFEKKIYEFHHEGLERGIFKAFFLYGRTGR